MLNHPANKDGLRLAADELGRDAKSSFQRKTRIERSDEIDCMVARAAARAKEGDQDAVRYLYLRFADNVYSYVRTIVRDEHEAEDVTQHVFAKLITAISKYDPHGGNFSGWIMRLSHNVAIDHLRRRRATPTEEIFGSDERTDDTVADRSCSLHEALRRLPDEQRQVVVLRHVVGLTPPEIASTLGRSESSIHGLHHRGRRALRDDLVSMEAAPLIGSGRARAVEESDEVELAVAA
jgi:RNA polymerase sigma-70 factor (ECF subfamily)